MLSTSYIKRAVKYKDCIVWKCTVLHQPPTHTPTHEHDNLNLNLMKNIRILKPKLSIGHPFQYTNIACRYRITILTRSFSCLFLFLKCCFQLEGRQPCEITKKITLKTRFRKNITLLEIIHKRTL